MQILFIFIILLCLVNTIYMFFIKKQNLNTIDLVYLYRFLRLYY